MLKRSRDSKPCMGIATRGCQDKQGLGRFLGLQGITNKVIARHIDGARVYD